MGYIVPDWPAPPNVRAVITTRTDGFSTGPFAEFNLATHVGDDPAVVAGNREKLKTDLKLREDPRWLKQVHGVRVIDLDTNREPEPEADAALAASHDTACAVLTADCLPVLFCNRQGTKVAAAHAGWRGLAAGVLRNTVVAMGESPRNLLAYLGPAISQRHFEVGEEVRDSILDGALGSAHRAGIPACFRIGEKVGKLFCDLYGLARLELHQLGLKGVYGGQYCTYGDIRDFYSFRRDAGTGRMASLVLMDSHRSAGSGHVQGG